MAKILKIKEKQALLYVKSENLNLFCGATPTSPSTTIILTPGVSW